MVLQAALVVMAELNAVGATNISNRMVRIGHVNQKQRLRWRPTLLDGETDDPQR